MAYNSQTIAFSNGYFIATFSEKVKNHKYLANHKTVMLLERWICDISRVLVLARNSVYSARSVEDAIPHVYKMEGHRPFRENLLILSS